MQPSLSSSIFFPVIRAKRRFLRPKKEDQVAQIGGMGGVRWFGQCPKEKFFHVDVFPNRDRWLVKFWQTFIWTVLFSFRYSNIDIPNDNKWGGWWGFGTVRIAEISVFFLKSLLYHVWYISNAFLIFQNTISGIP